MDDLSKLMSSVTNFWPREAVGKDEVRGLFVSTVLSSDMGYETALCDTEGIYPVERYDDQEQAIKGHNKWLRYAQNYHGQKVVELGYGSLIEDKEVTLKPDIKKVKVVKPKEIS